MKELVACGDGMNDIPMLKYAGLAAVMENAYPEVKKYAMSMHHLTMTVVWHML